MNLKSEIRNSKAELLPEWHKSNSEIRRRTSAFGLRISFGFRPSDFGLRSQHSRAFTLIEVVLALGISAIVLAGIGGVFYSAMRLRERTIAMLEESAPLQQAVSFLRRDLKGVVPPGGTLAGSLQSGVVSGNLSQNNGIEIYTTTGVINDNAPWGEIQKVTYQLEDPTTGPRTGGKDLVRSVTRNLLSTSGEEAEDQFLMSNVQDLQFAYFDGRNWVDTWNDSSNTTNLPTAVRVQLQLFSDSNAGNRNQEPIELIFPLMAQARTNQTTVAGGGQ